MARKRKGTRKRSSRGRRMSGPGGFDFVGPLATAGGAVVGTYLVNGPLKTESWANWAVIGAGILIPRFMKGNITQALGNGLVAAGVVSFAQNAGAISGVPGNVYVGSAAGGGPIQSIAGGRRMGIPAAAQAAAAGRRAAAGRSRVVLNGMGPIQSVAGMGARCGF